MPRHFSLFRFARIIAPPIAITFSNTVRSQKGTTIMAKGSVHDQLDKVRKPHVHIKYEVWKGDAMKLADLPFVMGVMGDYSGKPEEPLPPMKQRKFVEIDRDNFDKILAGMKPRLAFRVDDKISGKQGQELGIELRFNSMDDFKPDNVVKQIAPLRELLEIREKLDDLSKKMDGNEKFEELMNEILKNTALAKSIAPPATGKESK